MKEDFLHYLWKFKKFDVLNLKLLRGGSCDYKCRSAFTNQDQIFNAKITIAGQLWRVMSKFI
jgi:hypothetical protein